MQQVRTYSAYIGAVYISCVSCNVFMCRWAQRLFHSYNSYPLLFLCTHILRFHIIGPCFRREKQARNASTMNRTSLMAVQTPHHTIMRPFWASPTFRGTSIWNRAGLLSHYQTKSRVIEPLANRFPCGLQWCKRAG